MKNPQQIYDSHDRRMWTRYVDDDSHAGLGIFYTTNRRLRKSQGGRFLTAQDAAKTPGGFTVLSKKLFDEFARLPVGTRLAWSAIDPANPTKLMLPIQDVQIARSPARVAGPKSGPKIVFAHAVRSGGPLLATRGQNYTRGDVYTIFGQIQGHNVVASYRYKFGDSLQGVLLDTAGVTPAGVKYFVGGTPYSTRPGSENWATVVWLNPLATTTGVVRTSRSKTPDALRNIVPQSAKPAARHLVRQARRKA